MIEEVFNKLCAEATNDRIKSSLIAIHAICQEQHERGSKDFSIAMISRLGDSRGVPKAQSIRNKTGERYRTLINAWQETHSEPKVVKTSSSLSWVERIEDPTIRYLVYDLVSTNKNLTSELQLCKSVTKLNIDMRVNSNSVETFKLPKSQSLIESEVEALKCAIDNEFLERMGWEKTLRGAIVDHNGQGVFKNGFVSGIKKITSFAG